ncbi:type 1 glutamine amidotransferase [Saccharopolyspora sp. CA-218241]|uniref:type 1 glutamine amidotransferase n=1 Tax=Saccharopolyspora sp. CA-218241 TaxID=3240027 RepID=UPI003D9922E0
MGGVRVLVVEPSRLDPSSPLGGWLADAGAEVEVVRPAEEPLPATLDGYQGLIVLGGLMGAHDDLEHPWLAEVRGLLSSAVAKQVPALAVSLGAQLLAAATGGQVRPMPKGPEAGTLLIAKRDVAAEDVLLGPAPLTPDVLQFHGDEVSVLPPSAQLLASSPKCENQAFRVGACGYGVQFHVESSPAVVRSWLERAPEIAAAARPGHWDDEHLADFHVDLAETWRPVVERFVGLAGTPVDERRSSRFLPLA